MQRWFFDNFDADASAVDAHPERRQETDAANGEQASRAGRDGRWHTFRVLVNQHMEPIERVAVTGECSLLGRWMPANCIQLNRENG